MFQALCWVLHIPFCTEVPQTPSGSALPVAAPSQQPPGFNLWSNSLLFEVPFHPFPKLKKELVSGTRVLMAEGKQRTSLTQWQFTLVGTRHPSRR